MHDCDIRARFNAPGHWSEWTIRARGFDLDTFIPQRAVQRLAEELGDEFYVENRGSRVEITSRHFRGETPDPHASTIEAALPLFARALYGSSKTHTHSVTIVNA